MRGEAITPSLRVGVVQMVCEKGDIAGNLRQIDTYIGEAERRGTDILVFPEMSITGYIDPIRAPEAALRLNGPEVAEVVEMTRGKDLTVLAGLVEATHQCGDPPGKPFITQIVVRHGTLAGSYRKVTIADDEAPRFVPGTETPIFQHDRVAACGYRFGVAICADSGNRDLFATYARKGARAVFLAAAPGLYGDQATRDWEMGFRWWRRTCAGELGAYAREYGLWIAVATQAGRTIDEDFPGGGYIFDPSGKCVAATDDWSEGVLYAQIG